MATPTPDARIEELAREYLTISDRAAQELGNSVTDELGAWATLRHRWAARGLDLNDLPSYVRKLELS